MTQIGADLGIKEHVRYIFRVESVKVGPLQESSGSSHLEKKAAADHTNPTCVRQMSAGQITPMGLKRRY